MNLEKAYYYAEHLLEGSDEKTVDECYSKFVKKFKDPLSREAFKYVFRDWTQSHHRHKYSTYRYQDPHVEEWLVCSRRGFVRDPAKILIKGALVEVSRRSKDLEDLVREFRKSQTWLITR